MFRRSSWLSLLGLASSSSIAWAHPQVSVTSGGSWNAGFAHPLLGADHLLAMFAVGLLAVQLGRRAWWALPAGFMSGMLAGGLLGLSGWQLPGVEMAIGLSLVVLGGAVVLGRQYPLVGSSLGVALLGLFHGHAHGTEIPMLAAPGLYVVGFLTATLILHLAGAGLGVAAARTRWLDVAVRLAGAAMGVFGLLLVL